MNSVLWLGAGAFLAIGLSALTRLVARRHEQMICVFGLILAALIYLAQSLLHDAWRATAIEAAGALCFSTLAVIGWRGSALALASGWLLHAGWDLWGHATLAGNFMPYWYRWACAGFDLVIGGYIWGRFAKS